MIKDFWPKRSMLVFVMFLFLIPICYGQELSTGNSDKIKKNVLYATVGVNPEEFYGTIMANYERRVIEFPSTFPGSLWVRAGAGPWVWWTGNGINFVSAISLLTGKKAVHLEAGFGALLTYNPDVRNFAPILNDDYLAANIGFRIQKPAGKFVFRTGIGWPEFLYIGMGYCF